MHSTVVFEKMARAAVKNLFTILTGPSHLSNELSQMMNGQSNTLLLLQLLEVRNLWTLNNQLNEGTAAIPPAARAWLAM